MQVDILHLMKNLHFNFILKNVFDQIIGPLVHSMHLKEFHLNGKLNKLKRGFKKQ